MDNLELDKQFHISHQDDTYYHQYVRLYLANIALTSQVKQLVQENDQLACRLSKYEDEQVCSSHDRQLEKIKRIRRTANRIQRFYKCSQKECDKSYGSEGSLNQHYKIKHPEIYATLPSILTDQCNLEQPEVFEKIKPKNRQAKKKEN